MPTKSKTARSTELRKKNTFNDSMKDARLVRFSRPAFGGIVALSFLLLPIRAVMSKASWAAKVEYPAATFRKATTLIMTSEISASEARASDNQSTLPIITRVTPENHAGGKNKKYLWLAGFASS